MTNSKSIDQLLLAIKKEHELYQDMLKLSRKKSNLIINGEINELKELTAKEQALILSIGKIEEIRQAILENIKKENGFNNIEDLADLAGRLDKQTGEDILKLRDEFSILLREVRSSNELNGKLLQQSLELIEFNTNLLTTIDNTTSPVYNNRANDNSYDQERSFFELKV